MGGDRIDLTWYFMGKKSGEGRVIIESDTYQFTDPDSDGNIVITAQEE